MAKVEEKEVKKDAPTPSAKTPKSDKPAIKVAKVLPDAKADAVPKAEGSIPQREGREDRRPRRGESEDGIKHKLIAVRRVTKVVKGGRNMRFSATVVAGDGNGRVGIGSGKANEVPIAIEKALQEAKRKMVKVSLLNSTIPHKTNGYFGTSNVIMLPAAKGTGVIAGGAVRSVMEVVGIKDIRTKSHGTSNLINVARATIEGLKMLNTREEVAALRGKSVVELVGFTPREVE